MENNTVKLFFIFSLTLGISSCATLPPPANVDHICQIFKQYPRWYYDALRTEKRWKVPIHVQMAIIHQESKFNATAKPQRTKLLWIIPWTRPSTAYGYAQALNSTWKLYQKKRAGMLAHRENFAQGVDFIGWYAHLAQKRAYISPSDPYNLYLAYHEGIGGFLKKTYLKKKWLIAVAKKVQMRSLIYRAQLLSCRR